MDSLERGYCLLCDFSNFLKNRCSQLQSKRVSSRTEEFNALMYWNHMSVTSINPGMFLRSGSNFSESGTQFYVVYSLIWSSKL